LPAIFVDRGFPLELAATALTLYGIASITAKMAWGRVASRFSLRTMLLGLTLFGAVTVPIIVFLPADVGAMSLGYGFIVGLYVGAYVFLSQLVWSDYFGRAHVGAISSTARPLAIIIGSSGPFLLAVTRDATGSYDFGIMLHAVAALLCFACLLLVRPVRQTLKRPAPTSAQTQPLS
jgi:cyanate permease